MVKQDTWMAVKRPCSSQIFGKTIQQNFHSHLSSIISSIVNLFQKQIRFHDLVERTIWGTIFKFIVENFMVIDIVPSVSGKGLESSFCQLQFVRENLDVWETEEKFLAGGMWEK